MFLEKFFKKKKPKVAIVSLTSCEGCQFVILDLGKRFLDLTQDIELEEFGLLEDDKEPQGQYDIVFVEGNPITEEDIEKLKQTRKKAKKLIVLGNCADMGGVWEIKNYYNKEEIAESVYKKKYKRIKNPNVREVGNFVKVDFSIPTCPIDGEEFLRIAKDLIKGKTPEIKQSPVCSECPKRGTKDCYLVKGDVCLGLISFAGCHAICPANNQPCYGCRGLRKDITKESLKVILDSFRKKNSVKKINNILEFFGLKDDIVSKLREKK